MISYNPFDGSELGRIQPDTTRTLSAAIERAEKAQREWERIGFDGRVERLQAYAGILRDQRDALARLIAAETGKPLWESLTEASAMGNKVAISITACEERSADVSQSAGSIRYRALGVVAVLGPFNFPGHLPNGHIVPALLAGNAVLFKPSEFTPLVGQKIVEYLHQAGIPTDVVQPIYGGADIGRAICDLPNLKGLFFTGSSKVGLSIHRQFAGRPQTLLALEMGGNNPLMVEAVEDMPAASRIICQSAFVTAGQRCTCARRLVIPEGAFGDGLVEQLLADMASIRVGDPLGDPQPFVGTLISTEAVERALHFEASLIASGASVLKGLARSDASPAILEPALIDSTHADGLADEECFAPLLQVQRYRSTEEAYALCNDTAYGLAAGLLSDSEASYRRFREAVSVGIANWNTPLTGASSALPFGGTGLSGNHRPSAFFAADYCAYPVASIEQAALLPPADAVGFGKDAG